MGALSGATLMIVTGTCPFHFSFLHVARCNRFHVAPAATTPRQFPAGDRRSLAGISGSRSIIAARANLSDPLEWAAFLATDFSRISS